MLQYVLCYISSMSLWSYKVSCNIRFELHYILIYNFNYYTFNKILFIKLNYIQCEQNINIQ